MDTKTFENLFRDESKKISEEKFQSLFADDPSAVAPTKGLHQVDDSLPPQLTSPGIVPPKNRIIPTDTTLPFPIPELPGPKPRPKPALPEPIPFNLASGAVQLPAEQPIQEEPQILTELLPSLKSGYERTRANVLNWLPDLAQYREEHPWIHLAEMVFGIGGGLIPPRPISDEDKARMRAEAQKGYRKSLEEGRPLQFSEINELKDYRSYMYGLIGSSAPQMVGSILSLGTMTPLLLSAEMNEGMKDIEGLTLEEKIPLVKAGGLIAAAFENIGLGVLFRGIPKEVLAKVGMNKIVGIMEKSLAKRIAGRGIATSLTEAGTETLQDGTFMIGEYIAGKDFKPGEIVHRLKESAIGGGLLGGHIGMGVKGVQETGKGVEAIGKPVLPEDALENPFAKSLERQLFDALDTGIIPNFQKIELPEIDTRPPLFEGEAGPNITPIDTRPPLFEGEAGPNITPVPPSSGLESTPPTEVSPTEVQGPVFDEHGYSYIGETDEEGIPHGQGVKEFDPERKSAMTRDVDPKVLIVKYEGEFRYGSLYNGKAYNAAGELRRTVVDGDVVKVKPEPVVTEPEPVDVKPETPGEWQDYKNAKGKTLAQIKEIGVAKWWGEEDKPRPIVVRKNKDGIFRVAQFYGTDLTNIPASQLFTNAYGGFDNVPSGLLNKFATEAEATEAAKSFLGEPVEVKPKPPEVKPKPPEERVFKPLVDEKGKPESQAVIKALTVREGREDIVSDMFHLTIDIHKASGKKVAKVLKDRGLITEEIQHPQLTPKGKELALQIKENEELVDEGLPMEQYTPKKGVTVKSLKGKRGIVVNIEGKEWDGSPLYSNGIWALKGEVPKGVTPVTKVDFTPIIEGTPTESKTTPAVDPIAFSQVPGDEKVQVHFAPNDPSLTAETVTIDGKQYDLIKKLVPDAKFVVAESKMRPIAIYSGDERVGIIMPTRNEGGPARQPGITAILRKYQDEKKAKPAEVKPKAKPKAKPPVVEAPTVKMVEPEPVSSYPQSREDLEKLFGEKVSPAKLDAMLEPDVWKGLVHGKPTRLKVFRGEGKRAVYAEGVEGAALGEGRYSALKEDDAKVFGDVKPLTVELKQPAVLTSDEDLVKWFGEAIPSENADRVPLLKKARAEMVKHGYDGVIINIPKMADANEKGKTAKRLREIFNVSQVVEFKSKPSATESLGDEAILSTASEEIDQKRQVPPSIRELIYVDMASAANMDESLSMDERVGILRNYTPRKLEEVFSKMMYDKFGIRIEKATSTIDITLDNMMDAYVNFEGMAAVLGAPLKIMGLNETLSYQTVPLMKKRNSETFALYAPGQVLIKVGERNRSFAHEWMHALDFHILETMGQGKSTSGGMSGRLRGKEQKDPDDHTWYKNTLEPWMEENTTERIKLAFADLLNVVFFSDAEVAAKIMALELKIAKARSEDVIAGYNKDIRDLENGMSSKRLRKTYYYWGAKEQDLKEGRDPDGPGYYIMPTEMLARAFEAYMANKIELQAQTAEYPGTELITMPDWAYKDKKFTPGPIVELQNPQIDERWEKIYPKNGDRHAIFRAFDYLFEALVEDVYEGEAAIAKPSRSVEHPLLGTRVEDVRPWKKEAKINAARRIKGARNQQLQEDKRMELAERWKSKTKSERAWIKFEDGMALPILFSKRAQLFAQIRKYRGEVDAEGNPVPVSDALTEIMRRIIDDPGGRTLFLKGKDDFIGTWTEATRSGIRRELTAFKIVIDKRDALNFTEDEQKQLRLLMVSDPATIKKAELAQLNKNVVKLAGELRIVLNRIFKYGKSAAGISFLEPNAYLPRMIDRVMLDMEEGTFRSQSTKMFEEVLWIQEVGELNDGDLEQFKLIGEIAAHPRMQFQRDGSAETFTEPNRDIQTIARLTKDIKRLEQKIEKAQEDGDGEKFEYFQNELNKIIADLPVLHAGLHERAYKEVGHGWSVEHTNEWVRNLHLPKGDSGNFGLEPSPFISNFTKQRKFGREADTYMANFYQPAIESISSYIQAVIKKTEFNKRFSPDYIKAHRKKDRYATKTRHGKKGEHSRDYLEWLMDEKLAMYMSAEDFEAARTDIMTILGRNPPPKSTYYKHLNWFHSVGLTFMLTEAAATSFAEPFVTGVVTGRGKDGLKSFALTLQELLQYVSKDVRQTVQARHQLANILGVVDASGMTDIAVNRLGGLMVDDPKTNKWVSQFFKISGLQGLTMAQRRSVMAIGFQFFKEKANQFMNPVGDNAAAISKNKKEARDILLEYGIAKGKEEEFAFWFLPVMEGKKLPDASDIMNLYGEMNEMQKYLAVAINRLVNRSIQDPEPASKPRHAEGPWGRMIYSIMGFSYSVHANVIKPVYRDLKAVGPTESLASIARHKRGSSLQTVAKSRAGRLKLYGKGTVKQAQVWSKIAPSLVGLYVTHAMVTVMREMLTNKERWDKWEKEGVLWERIFELAFYRTGTTGALDPLLQAVRAMRYDVDLTRMVIGATPSFWAQNVNAMARALISERNSPNTTAYEKKGLEGFYRSVIGPLILAAATNPRTFSALGPYASLTAGAFAVTAASDTAQQGFSSVILDTVFPKGKGAEAFRRARGIRKGRKGRKSR